jgi:hypothetical protein
MSVIVLGMHRSGTSAVTAAVAALGVPLGDAADQMPAGEDNAAGFHESRSLSAFNELLLLDLQGRWDAPPSLATGWAAAAELAPQRERAAELFAAVHHSPSWVWKDPRLSVLAPFWFEVLDAEPRIVLAFRHPLGVARSLRRRDRLSKTYALALWERTTRLALLHAAGRSTAVVNYTRLVSEQGRVDQWARELAPFVASDVVTPVDDPVPAVASAIEPDLRHNRVDEGAFERDVEATAAQRRLYELLLELEGVHEPLRLPGHIAESARTDVRIAEHRACRSDDMQCPHRRVDIHVAWPLGHASTPASLPGLRRVAPNL